MLNLTGISYPLYIALFLPHSIDRLTPYKNDNNLQIWKQDIGVADNIFMNYITEHALGQFILVICL